MHATTLRRRALPALALAAAALGGCATQDDRLIALENENLELRQQNRNLDESLREAQTQRALLEGEVRALEAENDRLRLEAAASPTDLGPTGFENIEGVTAANVGGGVLLDVEGDVLFASGSTTLRSTAKRTLDRIAQVLRNQYGGATIRIAGHTDTDPIRKSKWKTNERLSAERALAVEEYLAEKGLSKDAMYVAAFGPAEPKASKAQSRRVEIFVIPG
jgi:flagellar motor protein MotB